MVVFDQNESLSSIAKFVGALHLWYAKKAEQRVSDVKAPRENIPSSINVIRQPIDLKNLGCTCYFNALI